MYLVFLLSFTLCERSGVKVCIYAAVGDLGKSSCLLLALEGGGSELLIINPRCALHLL